MFVDAFCSHAFFFGSKQYIIATSGCQSTALEEDAPKREPEPKPENWEAVGVEETDVPTVQAIEDDADLLPKVIPLGLGLETWSPDEDANFVPKRFVVGKENADFKVLPKAAEFDNWETGVGISNENLPEASPEKSDEDVDLLPRVVPRLELENWEAVVGTSTTANEAEWCTLVAIFGLFTATP